MCSKQGSISTLPDVEGILVFMKGHVGVYIGSGYVIEARGHNYGVVKTKLASRPWTQWGKLDLIDYSEEETEMTHEEKMEFLKEKLNIDDNTCKYLEFYRFSDALIEKIVKALQNK